MAEFSDKFVAFVDILGFKSMVGKASRRDGVTLDDLLLLTQKLGPTGIRGVFEEYGPGLCPEATRIRKDLDFQVIQISDCVIVSSEISPAGLINLIHYCWAAVLRLLTEGILCRGYITQGPIYHTDRQVIGPAYQEAHSREGNVSVFADVWDEKKRTPFVEIAPMILEYVDSQSDQCVSKMFDRMVRRLSDGAAIFPFKRLNAGDAIPEALLEANAVIRQNLHRYKQLMWSFIGPDDAAALPKVRYYDLALDEQLRLCDELDKVVEEGARPAVAVCHVPPPRP